MLVGPSLLIDPAKIKHVFSSPRTRALQTYELAFGEEVRAGMEREGVFSKAEELAEWGYGDYEGLLTGEIRELRRGRGLDGEGEWDIWRDGCEGGEYVFFSPSSSSSHFNFPVSASAARVRN